MNIIKKLTNAIREHDYSNFKLCINEIKAKKYDIMTIYIYENGIYYNTIEYMLTYYYPEKYLSYIEEHLKIYYYNPIDTIKIYTNYIYDKYKYINYVIKNSNIQYKEIPKFLYMQKNLYKNYINKRNYKKILQLYYTKFIKYSMFDKNLLLIIFKYLY